MFWSKIWLFLVALAAAATMTIALALPRSAHKSRIQDERQRLVVACDVVNILLEEKAHEDVSLVGTFSRDASLVTALGKVKVDQDVKATESPAKDIADIASSLMSKVEGHQPKMAMITDAKGRVVTRIGIDEGQIGDVEAGRYLIDDALAGYLRDDLWAEQKGTLYLVAASPIVARSTGGDEIIGAAVLGWKLDNDLADGFIAPFRDAAQEGADNRSIHAAFFAGDTQVAKSATSATLDADLVAEYGTANKTGKIEDDCKAIEPFYAKDNNIQYAAVMSRLPGEAEHERAFFAVFTPRPSEATFGGAVSAAKGELGGGFPWLAVGLIFVIGFGGGVALMIFEADRPLRRLQADAVRLAKGDKERLVEEDHAGRFGSIARSVNIQIDKLVRDTRAARKDLDHLLGPAPEGSLGAMDLLGGTPLPSRPSIPISAPAAPSAPPPSEFRFNEGGGGPKKPAAPGPDLDLGPSKPAAARPAAPPPAKPPAPPPIKPPMPAAPPPKKALDDDILSFADDSSEVGIVGAEAPRQGTPVAAGGTEESYFREVFDQFVELKKKCGEPTAGLTFAKFGDKLRKNKEELVQKTGCREVRFTVYVKDGKAALKATPVKD